MSRFIFPFSISVTSLFFESSFEFFKGLAFRKSRMSESEGFLPLQPRPALPSTDKSQGPQEGRGGPGAQLGRCRSQPSTGLLALRQITSCVGSPLSLVFPSTDLSRCHVAVGKREEQIQGKESFSVMQPATRSASLDHGEWRSVVNTSSFWSKS